MPDIIENDPPLREEPGSAEIVREIDVPTPAEAVSVDGQMLQLPLSALNQEFKNQAADSQKQLNELKTSLRNDQIKKLKPLQEAIDSIHKELKELTQAPEPMSPWLPVGVICAAVLVAMFVVIGVLRKPAEPPVVVSDVKPNASEVPEKLEALLRTMDQLKGMIATNTKTATNPKLLPEIEAIRKDAKANVDHLETAIRLATANPKGGNSNLDAVLTKLSELKDRVDALPKSVPDAMGLSSELQKLATKQDELRTLIAAMNKGTPTSGPELDRRVATLKADLIAALPKAGPPIGPELDQRFAALKAELIAAQPKAGPPIGPELDQRFAALSKQLVQTQPAAQPDGPVVDVAVVCCHSKLDARSLGPTLNRAVQETQGKSMRLGVYLARGGNLVTLRELKSIAEPVGDLSEKLRATQDPDGIEKPGQVMGDLRGLMRPAKKVVVLIVTTAADVPDPAVWGEAEPQVFMVQPLEPAVDPTKLAEWVQFVGKLQGSLTLLPWASADAAGYEALNIRLSRQMGLTLGAIRR